MNYTVLGDRDYMIVPYDAELKAHLRVSDDTDQTLITSYIKAAAHYIEKRVGYPITTDEITVMTKAWAFRLDLPRTVTDITTLEKFDDGAWTAVTIGAVTLEDYGVYKAYYNEDLEDNMMYRVTCENTATISPNMKMAAYLLIAEFYENRENRNINVSVFRPHVDILLDTEVSLI